MSNLHKISFLITTRTPNPLKGAVVLSIIEVLKSPLGDLGVLTEIRGKLDLK